MPGTIALDYLRLCLLETWPQVPHAPSHQPVIRDIATIGEMTERMDTLPRRKNMNAKQRPHLSMASTAVRIVPVTPEKQTRRVKEAIAKRRYQIVERRSGRARHETE